MILNVFLDTSYLMPLFGMENSIPNFNEEMKTILKSNKFQFHYSLISLIEIKWLLIKKTRKNEELEKKLENRYANSCKSLKKDIRYLKIDFLNPDINNTEYQLRKLGHSDYFDRIIGSSAIWSCDLLISEDRPLKEILLKLFKKKNEQSNYIIVEEWSKFKRRILSK